MQQPAKERQVRKARKRPAPWILSVLAICAFGAHQSSAQISKGSISGTVIDSQEFAVAGAQVNATNQGTNQEFSTISDSAGFFRLNLLPIGNYRVEILANGFKALIVAHVPVNSASDEGLAGLQMEVGEVATAVDVPWRTALIESTDAQVSSSFGRQTLTSFSGILENNGLDNLALSVPGVVNSRDLGVSRANGAQFGVNGLRGRSNDQQIDGQNNNDNSATGPALVLSDPEFVEEYQITTNNFGPEYGRNSGSVVNILTKSGTNSLHGSVYGTEGNWRLNALSTTEKTFERLTQVPAFNDTFVGGTIGDAIVENKLFFFGGADSEILNQAGVFGSGQLTATPAGISTLTACFPGSASVQALETYGPYAVKAGSPLPQGTSRLEDFGECAGVEMAGIQRVLPEDIRQHNFIVRLDYQTAKSHFYGRYVYAKNTLFNNAGNAAAGYPADTLTLSQDYAFSWARAINNRTANEFRTSYGRLNSQEGGNSIGNTVPRSNQLGNALTSIIFNDPSLLSLGVPLYFPQGRIVNTYQIQDNWTHLAGRHSLKAGVDFTYLQSANIVFSNYNGAFRFNDYGALAANWPNRIQIASGNPNLDFREKDTFLYFGDDLRLRQNLVLNLGVTWSYYGQPANLLHTLTTQSQTGSTPLWNPSLPLDVTTLPAIPAPKNSWGPDVGFAWSPGNGLLNSGGGKIVVRGGYRLAYDPPYYDMYLKVASGAPSVLLTTLTGADAIANPLPAVPTGPNVRALLAPHLQTGIFDPREFSENTIPLDFGPDRVHEWSLGLQREITEAAVFEVRYVGNHGQHLFQSIDGNPFILGLANLYPNLVPTGVTPCSASQAAIPETVGRVYCDRGALVRERTNTGYSDYQALQTEFRSTHLWNQLTLRAAYTFSKTTDNASEIAATLAGGGTFGFPQNQLNFTTEEHGLSGLDFPQNLVLSVLEELPFYSTRRGFLERALGGWQVSALYILSSGQPYTAAQSGLNCATGGGACGGIPDTVNPYDPQFNAAFAGPDGALRPFLGASSAPPQSVGIFANDVCAVDVSGNLCGSPAIGATTLISLNQFNDGFRGTKTDATGNTVADSGHPASVVTQRDVHFIANTATAARVFGTPFGNVGRNTLRDYHTNVLNLSLFKTTHVSEKWRIQFHVDFLNAFNHPNYASIDPFIDDAGLFAEGTGFADPRAQSSAGRTICFGLKIYF
jgi:Carboxypeptidase regulatory-like domain